MKKIIMLMYLFLLPSIAAAFPNSPPDTTAGVPGEYTCVVCHSSFPLNSGDGNLTISGPAKFQLGQTYTISVQLSDPGQVDWGFELSPLNKGAITVTDAVNTQLSISSGNSYVKQTSPGTYAGTPDGPVSWSFDWTAPSSPTAQVTFYAAGLAADGNNDAPGDYVYTTTFTTTSFCQADFTNDGKVNLTDLGKLKSEFGRTNCNTEPCQADANNDGKVNLTDLGKLKSEFGRTNCF
jgi:hypothetical protein